MCEHAYANSEVHSVVWEVFAPLLALRTSEENRCSLFFGSLTPGIPSNVLFGSCCLGVRHLTRQVVQNRQLGVCSMSFACLKVSLQWVP